MKNHLLHTNNLRILSVLVLSAITIVHSSKPEGATHTHSEDPDRRDRQEQTTEEMDADFARVFRNRYRPRSAAEEERLQELAEKFCDGLGENTSAGRLGYAMKRKFGMVNEEEQMIWHRGMMKDDATKEERNSGQEKRRRYFAMPGGVPVQFDTFAQEVLGGTQEPGKRKRFLAYGPTGVGKTTSIRALEEQDPKIHLMEKQASRLLGKTDKETSDNIQAVFDEAAKEEKRGQKVVILIQNLQDLRSVTSDEYSQQNPLSVLQYCLDENEEEGRNIYFVGELRNLSALPVEFLDQLDASEITMYSLPDGNSRCLHLAYNFYQHVRGSSALTRDKMRGYVNESSDMNYRQLDGAVRDTVKVANVSHSGELFPGLIENVIQVTKAKNRDKKPVIEEYLAASFLGTYVTPAVGGWITNAVMAQLGQWAYAGWKGQGAPMSTPPPPGNVRVEAAPTSTGSNNSGTK